jgi:hypothetical protein
VVVLNGNTGLEAFHVKVGFGEVVKLDASQSWDPDGDGLKFMWMHYREPSATQWTCYFEVPKLEFEDVLSRRTWRRLRLESQEKMRAVGILWTR